MLDLEHRDEIIGLGSVGYREIWDLMDTGEDTCMESHPYDRIERWIDAQCLLDGLSTVIGLADHRLLDEECIILILSASCGEHEEHRRISELDESIIDEWYDSLVVPEKSSSDRYPHSLALHHIGIWWLCWLMEEYDILDLE
jgi:hypothetical protein